MQQHSEKQGEKNKALPVREFKAISNPAKKGRIGFPLSVQYKGLFDFATLYKFMILWMKERRFEVHETVYKYRDPELQVRWEAERKKTHFFLEKIHIHIVAVGDHHVEVTENNKKKMMVRGRLVITLDGELVAPYESTTGNLPWNTKNKRKLLDKFFRYVFRQDALFAEDDLYYIIVGFQKEVKEQLGMEA